MDSIKNYLIDMDGVVLRGTTLIPGAAEFLRHLRAQGIPFLILTNNSQYTARDLHVRLSYMGLDVPPEAIFTSALATAQFLHSQRPGGRAYAIGESGLTTALHDGARFIATNSDVMGPGEGGIVPATGAVAALISAATGVKPYFVGKPNPLMMRTALRTIEAHSEESVMIGDRMDTDIVAGTESGLRTILVLTGVTKREEVERFPYRPTWTMESVADIKVSDLTSEGEDLNESATRHLKVVGA